MAWVADNELISGGFDNVIRRSDVDSGTSRPLVANGSGIFSIQKNPTEPLLVSASFDGSARIWSDDGSLRAVWKVDRPSRFRASWNPDGRLVATGGIGTVLKLWDREGRPVQTSSKFGQVAHLAWSPDGERLVVSWDFVSKPIAAVFQLDGTAGPELQGHTDRIEDVAWNPRTNQIATASSDKTIRLWSADGKPGPELTGHTAAVNSLAWSPDGQMLASGGADGTFRLWSADGKQIRVLADPSYTGTLTGVSWSPDGQFVAAGGTDLLVHVWNVKGLQCRRCADMGAT